MKRKTAIFLLSAVMVLSLSTPASAGEETVEASSEKVQTSPEEEETSLLKMTLEDLEDGEHFCYRKTEWGIEREELEEKLNVSMDYLNPSIPTYLKDKEPAELEGMDAEVIYELRPGLETVRLHMIEPDEKQFEEMLKKMEEKYGEAETAESKLENGVFYRWFKMNEDAKDTKDTEVTSLQIMTKYEKELLKEADIYVGLIHDYILGDKAEK